MLLAVERSNGLAEVVVSVIGLLLQLSRSFVAVSLLSELAMALLRLLSHLLVCQLPLHAHTLDRLLLFVGWWVEREEHGCGDGR